MPPSRPQPTVFSEKLPTSGALVAVAARVQHAVRELMEYLIRETTQRKKHEKCAVACACVGAGR